MPISFCQDGLCKARSQRHPGRTSPSGGGPCSSPIIPFLTLFLRRKGSVPAPQPTCKHGTRVSAAVCPLALRIQAARARVCLQAARNRNLIRPRKRRPECESQAALYDSHATHQSLTQSSLLLAFRQTPFMRAVLSSEDDARRLGARCISLRAIYQLWADGGRRNSQHTLIVHHQSWNASH